jgi:hypothetical protein
MNKKGAISEAIDDFIAMGIFLIIIVAFFFFFKLAAQPKINAIQETQFPEFVIEQDLLTFLKLSIEYNGNSMSVAQSLVILDNTRDNKLKEKITAMFKTYADKARNKIRYINLAIGSSVAAESTLIYYDEYGSFIGQRIKGSLIIPKNETTNLDLSYFVEIQKDEK